MITIPRGYITHHGVHLVTMYPPDGGGRIRYYERLAPLKRASAIVDHVLANESAYRKSEIMEAQRTMTADGEYAAWISTRGTHEGAGARCHIGIVFCDEYAAALCALAILKPQFAMIEQLGKELLHGVTLGLPRQRRRRFLYTPPLGWQSMPNGLVANFHPPDFPNNLTNLVVYPATCSEGTPESLFENLLLHECQGGVTVDGEIRCDPFITDYGLAGSVWRFALLRGQESRRVFREIAIFADDAFRYTLRLETCDEARLPEHRDIFNAIAASVRPVPLAGQTPVDFVQLQSLAPISAQWSD